MKVILLVMGVLALLGNLKGYKGYFTPTKYKSLELKESLDALGEQKAYAQLFGVIFAVLLSLFFIVFYVVSGVVLSDITLLLAYSVIMVIWVLYGTPKLVKAILIEQLTQSKRRIIAGKILVPASTLYILYFIYFVFAN